MENSTKQKERKKCWKRDLCISLLLLLLSIFFSFIKCIPLLLFANEITLKITAIYVFYSSSSSRVHCFVLKRETSQRNYMHRTHTNALTHVSFTCDARAMSMLLTFSLFLIFPRFLRTKNALKLELKISRAALGGRQEGRESERGLGRRHSA